MGRVLVVLLLLGFLATPEAGVWLQNGEPLPDTSWAKSDGDFGAQLVFTDKPDDLFEAWEKPGPGVLVSVTPTAVRGGPPIVCVVFFVGCAKNEGDNCNTTVQFQAYTPDGRPWGDSNSGELWIDKPAPEEGQMQLGIDHLGILIEPTDPICEYKVRAEIRDLVAKRTMVLERTFTAVEQVASP